MCHGTPPTARRCGLSPRDARYFAARLRDGLGVQGRTPCRSRTEREQRAGQAAEEVGFGTAAAKARRMRLVVSTTRAAIFKRRRRSVANSAVANSRALGMASRTVSINQ